MHVLIERPMLFPFPSYNIVVRKMRSKETSEKRGIPSSSVIRRICGSTSLIHLLEVFFCGEW